MHVVSQDEFVAKKSNLFFKCHICVDHNETTSIKTFVWEDSSFTEQSTDQQCLIKSINFLFVDSGPCPEWDTNNDCCTDSKQCGIGRGHCDYDTECKWGLICGKKNCPSIYNHTEYGCCQGNSIM